MGTQERREKEAAKLAIVKAQAVAAAEQKRLDEKNRKNAITDSNAWLIDALTPHSDGYNFAGSIISQLGSIRYQDLSGGQKAVVAKILAKEAGRSNSTAFNTRYEQLIGTLNS